MHEEVSGWWLLLEVGAARTPSSRSPSETVGPTTSALETPSEKCLAEADDCTAFACNTRPLDRGPNPDVPPES